MKREYWFLLAGLFIGLLLGGVKCSLNIKQSPSPDAAIASGGECGDHIVDANKMVGDGG